MKAKKKRGGEPPPKVQAFIDRTLSVPLESIETALAEFQWEYEKGDIYHWVDLLNHLDSFLERYIQPRNDLRVEQDDFGAGSSGGGDDPPFPKEAVLQILRVTQLILENCSNKNCYSSHEHLSSLLASMDVDIVIATLQAFAAFVKKPMQSNRAVRWHGDQVLNAKLFSLCQGWGGKEDGLGVLACASEGGCDRDALKLGSTLHFEFYSDQQGSDGGASSGLKIIHVSDLHDDTRTDIEILKELIDQFNVPSSLRFSLLTRLRFARVFPNLPARRQFLSVRLLAFTVLFQLNPNHEDLTAFFTNQPEFVSELVSVICSEEAVPVQIRILAMHALAALYTDRSRQSIVLNSVSTGGNRGVLPSLMQKAIGSIADGDPNYPLTFLESLLYLVTVLVSSSFSCAALREAGLIPTLLPLLRDINPQHVHLVSSAVHILEAFLDYSNEATALFRDLGGLDDTISRLKLEIANVEAAIKKRRLEEEQGKKAVSADEGGSSSSSSSENLVPFHQRLLLKALLRAITLGTYATVNAARIRSLEDSALPACLCTIFMNVKDFGGGVFSLAASVLNDLIHKDPTCYAALDSAGVPAAFLDSVAAGVLPSSEAIVCIPHSLDALCLNSSGLQAVKDRNALGFLVKIFTSKVYSKALGNDTPGTLAHALDELMRHAPSLRGPCIDIFLEILSKIAVMGGGVTTSCTGSSTEATTTSTEEQPVPMETEIAVVTPGDYQASKDSNNPQETTTEAFLPESINYVARLLETILQNADSCRTFIEKKGIDALLRLYSLPHLPVSFGGSTVAQSLLLVFRTFSPHHSGALTRTVCGALRSQLQLTLEVVTLFQSAKLSDLASVDQSRVIRSLVATECFLALCSVLVKGTTTMLTELNAGDAEILSNIGKVHREVLWQISLVDNAKADAKEDDTGTAAGSSSQENTAATTAGGSEGDEDSGMFPLVLHANPTSLRGSSSNWRMGSSYLSVLQSGEGLHRRSHREFGGSSGEVLARLGFSRNNNTETPQVDMENTEGPQVQESVKSKSLESMNFEMLNRLAMVSRTLYVSIAKAMIVPSRRRDEAVVPTSAAKAMAASLATVMSQNLSFEGGSSHSSSSSGVSKSVMCRYLGKVVDDLTSLVFDARRRTCNTLMVNNLYAHGTFSLLLDTFQNTSKMLWMPEQPSCELPLPQIEGEDDKKGKAEKKEGLVEGASWLLETLSSYTRLMEHLVTSSLLLTPPPMVQLLTQQVSGVSHPVPKNAEAFVKMIQGQVLDVIMPLWTHPSLKKCGSNLIVSLAAILTCIYGGVGSVRGNGNTENVRQPPDESAVLTIIEMGFSRARAEEALRRVESNSVEMAMEWLFSHPEEQPQEEEDLARALALSLSNSDVPAAAAADEEPPSKEVEEENDPELPELDDMLTICASLLQNSDTIAFSVTDLLVTMCNRNHGEDRARVVSFLILELQYFQAKEADRTSSYLSTISHTLALLLYEDTTAREAAAEAKLTTIALNILSMYDPLSVSEASDVPKWVTVLLMVLDLLLQCKLNLSQDQPRIALGSSTTSANDGAGIASSSVPDSGIASSLVPDSEEVNIDSGDLEGEDPFVKVLGKSTGYMSEEEQQWAMKVVCDLLKRQHPASTVQAALQLCAHLTRTHSVAMQFLELGGLVSLLNLPRHCLFPGFDSVAAVIIRHLLEDPQTLQQAMESEIRHFLTSNGNRHNGHFSPRFFLTAMASVLSRNPRVFLKATASVCQFETVGGRPNIVLKKEKEREKEKDKEKEKDDKERDKDKPKPSSSIFFIGGGNVTHAVLHDSSSKSSKAHHKKVPQSFSHVIDHLLDIVLHFQVPPKAGRDDSNDMVTAMDIDERLIKEKGKAKLEGTVTLNQESSADIAKVAFILKLMTEILIMYAPAVGVVLRRDLESSQGRGPSHAGVEMIGHGGLLCHALHRLLPYSSDKAAGQQTDDEWREKLADKAAYFLMVICIRSGEGRRRVVSEISRSLKMAADGFDSNSARGSHPPSRKIRAFVDLVNLMLSAHSASSNAQVPGLSTDVAKTMIDVGLVQSLTSTLQAIDLDHPEAPKVINSILKALEALTRAANSGEQTIGAGGNNQKKTPNQEEFVHQTAAAAASFLHQTVDADASVPLPSDTAQLTTANPVSQSGDQMLLVGANGRTTTLEAVDDGGERGNQMELDIQLSGDGSNMLQEAEEFMHEASEDPSNRLAEATATQIAFNQEDNVHDDEDEEMDGDDGEDNGDDEEEEDDDDMEAADGVQHLSPPDTDVEDEHGLADEFGEDIVEDDEDEDEDEDDWHENRVIEVRWRDGLTGLNHVQVLGHPGSGAMVDFPGALPMGRNMDDIFRFLRRPAVADRRRPAGHRSFPERLGAERGVGVGGAFHHPLLSRPSTTVAVGGSSGGALSNTATATRDVEAMLGGGYGTSHFYMHDGHEQQLVGDGLLGDRAVGRTHSQLLDFSADSHYMLVRRSGGRPDGHLNSWTDDGQQPAGAHAAEIAQIIEEQFVSCMQNLFPPEERSPQQIGNAVAGEQAGGQATDTVNTTDGVNTRGVFEDNQTRQINENEGHSSGQVEAAPTQSGMEVREILENQADDTQMQDERSQAPPAASPAAVIPVPEDSASFRSVHSREERQGAEMQEDRQELAAVPTETGPVDTGMDSGDQHVNRDEDMGGLAVEGVLVTETNVEQEGGIPPTGEAALINETNSTPNSSSSIDPAFLEALPADLRAEVLASQQQSENASTANAPPPPTEEIDPEFLAALPPDIQAEVLAQQRARRLVQQVEGQPADMDSASIIATFPAELREEVLLTSSQQVLDALPRSLLLEAQLLRERAMHQIQSRGIFGMSHRMGSRRHITGVGTGDSAAMERGIGSNTSLSVSRRPVGLANSGIVVKDIEGKPLVDTSGLRSLLCLLRLAQPLGKGLLQRLLLNLCAHSQTRSALVGLLLDMLKPEAEEFSTSSGSSTISQRLHGCQWNVVYSCSQFSDGVPPLVSRRVLEILTYLSRNHPPVAGLLLYLELSGISLSLEPCEAKDKGKGKMIEFPGEVEGSEGSSEGEVPLILLLKLLNLPLYSRSSAHLEQVLGLLEVVINNVEATIDACARLDSATKSGQKANVEPTSATAANEVVNADSNLSMTVETVEGPTLHSSAATVEKDAKEKDLKEKDLSCTKSTGKPDVLAILSSLPDPELCKLSGLLGREGLSEIAYTRVAEVLRKLARAAPVHRRLFVQEMANITRGLGNLAVSELNSLSDNASVAVSTGPMAGAAVLRVLQCLSTMMSDGISKDKACENSLEDEAEDGVKTIQELSLALEPLWKELSVCIGKLESRLSNISGSGTSTLADANAAIAGTGTSVPLPPGTQRILPFVESFFVLCEKLRFGATQSGQSDSCSTTTACESKEGVESSDSSASLSGGSKPSQSSNRRSDGDSTFIKFSEKHRKLLNAFVRQNPGLLEKSLALLLKSPRLIDFDNKRAYFRSRIRQQHEQQHYAPLRVCVRRAYVLEDSYNQLRMRTPEELKGRLTIQFQGEEGIDAGGLTREWYLLISRVIFDKGHLLFTTVGNGSTFQPNPNSGYQPEHLSYFKFAGRVVGKALFDGQLLDVYFTRSFYKHMLAAKVTYHDIEAIDPDYYKNLKWMLEHDISEIMDLFFSVDADEEKHILYEKTEVTDIELIEGGRNIRVTEENKHEYVDLVAEHKLTTAIRPQINAFLEGFSEIIPRDLISIFNDRELELLISGLSDIDLDDLKANTEYTGYTVASPVVQWFWEAVRAFTKEDKARLLQFITGTSKVPLEGFKALQGISGLQKFQVHKGYGAPERLPTAHTCFNQLDLPEYNSKEELQERLLLAIHEANEGFGFG